MALSVLRVGAATRSLCSSESASKLHQLTSSPSSSSGWVRGAQPLLLHVALRMAADKKLGGSCRRACGRLQVHCVGWDPEGILGPPQGGHIARRTLEKLMQAEGDEKEAIEKQASLERERRRAAREVARLSTIHFEHLCLC
ncbi:hypothetical protein O6H91_Y066400 [Diphasiastrum complanatum]|nr:hypothetical protein O6H91_Y066400 [Diphasiastrum complanatum]